MEVITPASNEGRMSGVLKCSACDHETAIGFARSLKN